MRRSVTSLTGLALAVGLGIGAGAIGGAADSPELAGLTPLAPIDAPEPDSESPELFIDGEPVTPYDGDKGATLDGAGMVLPGFEGSVDDTVVEIGE